MILEKCSEWFNLLEKHGWNHTLAWIPNQEKQQNMILNNSLFGKTIENVRKHRDIKLVTTDKRRNQLTLEPNYHTTKYFSGNLMASERKIKVKVNKPIYLAMSILYISKTLMYEFGYDYIKPKY